MLSCAVAKGQVVADFTTDTRQGCAPFVVYSFTNLSTGTGYLTYLWDFGNGTTSTQQNPGTSYFSPGNYTVKVVVEDESGKKDSISKSNFITVYNSPVVNFTASNTSGCVPFTVPFTNQSTAGSGSIAKWEWDFGDGTTSLQQSPSHTYNINGDFTITLKVTNSFGCVEVQIKTAFIHVNQLPTANFTSGSAATCNPPVLVNFLNTSTGGPIVSTRWNFGDGVTSSEANPSHTYTAAGTYQVTLIVTNQNGCVDTITKPTVIGSVTPGFTGPDVVCQDAPAYFVNTSSPAIASAYWDFGDNTSSTDINPVKRFANTGSFVVKLVNNFGACKDSITRNITVQPKPVADFSYVAPPASCKLPVDVSFTANATGASSYFWDFGDGATSTLINPSHTYTTYGSFSATLTVTGLNGCTDRIIKPNIISIVPAKIRNFIDLPFTGCVPHQQTFSANITSPEPVTSYLWNFGDGNTSADSTPVYNYTTEGTFDVSLKITTTNGCTDTFRLSSAIAVANKPAANFSATPRVSCAYQSVQFTDLSTGNITGHLWKFGDGGFSEAKDPLYHYADTGFFTVRLIVSNLSCYDTLTIKDYIFIKPPIARFSVRYNCETPLIRDFRNRSVLAQTNEWTFGDGSPASTEISPVHTYASPGVYIVHLHITNNACYDDFTDTIQVIDEHPDFTLNEPVLCRNNTSVFTATNINTQNIATYSWNFGDSTPLFTGTAPVVNHNYVRLGVFSPVLTITDILGCIKTVEHPASITIYGPNAGFTNPEGACLNSLVTFTDQTQPTANHPITSWILNYGDGKADTTNTPTFSHTYTIPKTYDVFLIATDSYGCKDTLIKRNAINITSPKASFSLRDSISCNNSTVSFINQSSGLDLTYLWNFGDGVTSTTANPAHSYTAERTYVLSLAIKDRYGCTDSVKKTNGIVIGNAKASFTLSDSVISCPPAQINFVNTSTYSTALKWDFDDENFSEIPNPSHYFLTARTYHIKLTAYGHGSCADSTVKDIIVKGPRGSIAYTAAIKCIPSAVNFTASASNSNNSFTWDFGDGTVTTTSSSSISHAYTAPGRYLPKLILIDTALNCNVSVFGADTITVSGALSYIKAHQNLFCDSATLQFFDSSIVKYDAIASYSWTFGDGGTSTSQNPFHNYVASGVFPVRLIVKTTAGCTDSSENTFVKIVKSPQLQVTGPAATCVNQPVTYSAKAQDTSFIKWSWDFSNGKNYIVPSPPSQTYTLAGNYTVNVVVINSSGCTTTKSNVLKVNPLPNVDAGADSVICRGATLTLHASGAETYLWKSSPSLSCTACANPVASPVDTSVYYEVTGTNAITTCQNTDSVQVKVVQPFKITSIPNDTLCVGETAKLWVTGADNYTWSPATGLSNTNVANPVASPGTTTLYTVTGHDYHNCFTDVAYVPITVYPIPVFNIIEDNVTIAVGNSVTLKTTSSRDVTNWQWFPATGLSCSNCLEPVATPSNTIVYKATVTNGGGCRAEDRVTINVFCNNGNIFIPNTFSPNNDGSNDVFFPRGKGIAGVKNLQIFNRWGTIVFQKSNFAINDSRSGWNGMYNGKPLDADVFVYHIEVTCETGQVFSYKGDITLIR
ncbi:MAG: hypothetical protein JWQ09_5444 [Segetibacter sp.]|nr:hypothetical protein [Segetibacter sp.]